MESRGEVRTGPPTHSTLLRVVVSRVEPRLKHSGVTTWDEFILFDTPQLAIKGVHYSTLFWHYKSKSRLAFLDKIFSLTSADNV